MNFFSVNVDVYPSFFCGFAVMVALRGVYSHYKQTRQREMDERNKYYSKCNELYYRVSLLEDKLESMGGVI